MCTVTFIARKRGYALGMNRDEKLTRVQGLPPSERLVEGRRVICPSEPGAGTWISLNETGVTFALINWYSITARVYGTATSRGEVVAAVSAMDAGSNLPIVASSITAFVWPSKRTGKTMMLSLHRIFLFNSAA